MHRSNAFASFGGNYGANRSPFPTPGPMGGVRFQGVAPSGQGPPGMPPRSSNYFDTYGDQASCETDSYCEEDACKKRRYICGGVTFLIVLLLLGVIGL
ncbi:MAG: hypothetical protein MHM6MM_008857, partial [Cercozoa sp. M6MM]